LKINNDNKADNVKYSVIELTNDKELLGRMNDPSGASCLKGPCGDEMEFYLDIEDNIIKDIKYYTEGCEATKACGVLAARMAKNKTLENALCISAGEIMKNIKDLPEANSHCPILAVSSLYRAIADYLLKI